MSIPSLDNLAKASPFTILRRLECLLEPRKEAVPKELETLAIFQKQLLQEHRAAIISADITGKIDVPKWRRPDSTPEPPLESS